MAQFSDDIGMTEEIADVRHTEYGGVRRDLAKRLNDTAKENSRMNFPGIADD